jgi:hypothetical protein
VTRDSLSDKTERGTGPSDGAVLAAAREFSEPRRMLTAAYPYVCADVLDEVVVWLRSRGSDMDHEIRRFREDFNMGRTNA